MVLHLFYGEGLPLTRNWCTPLIGASKGLHPIFTNFMDYSLKPYIFTINMNFRTLAETTELGKIDASVQSSKISPTRQKAMVEGYHW